jgi:PAS domain S-box-containing protein
MTDLSSSLLDAVACGVLVISEHESVETANGRARRLLQLPPADAALEGAAGLDADAMLDVPIRSQDASPRASATTLRRLVRRAADRGEEVSVTGALMRDQPLSGDQMPHPGVSRPGSEGRGGAGANVARSSPDRTPDEPPVLTWTAAPTPDGVVVTLQPASPQAGREPDDDQRTDSAYLNILEAIAQGASSHRIASDVVALLEGAAPSFTIVALRHDRDTERLHPLAYSSHFQPHTDRLPASVPVEACGLCQPALNTRHPVQHDLRDASVADQLHPAWETVATASGAAVAWAVPIVQADTDVRGVLLMTTPDRRAAAYSRLKQHLDHATHLILLALERDHRRAALRRSNEQFRQVTESMREVFWLRTADRVLYVSPSFEDVWGRSREDLYADVNVYLEDVHPQDEKRVRAACSNLVRMREPLNLHYRIIRPSDGETRWMSVFFQPVENPGGEPRFAGIVRDVTDAYRSKRRLQQSERTYRNLIDHSSDAIYVQNASGEFVDLSRGALQMYGYTRDEMIGKTPAFVSAGERNDLDLLQDRFEKALNGDTQKFEFWGKRADGTVFPKEVRLQRATYFGQPVVVAFALDITDRKAAEEALRESEKRYRVVVQNMKDVVMTHDPEGGTMWVSPSVTDVLGRTPEDSRQLNAFDVIHPVDQERVATHLAALKDGVNLGPITYRVLHADGHYVWLESLVKATYDEHGVLTQIQSSSRDVTERVQRQRELRQAKRDAEDADRLKSAMLANMSHEIRTPLTSVIGFAEVLRDEVDPQHQQYAQLIHDSSRRLMQTLDSVLQLSKLEAELVHLEVSTLDLRAEVQDILDLLRPQAEARGVSLRAELPEDASIRGRWDAGALHRILTNLLGNAIKFTEAGGETCIRVERRDEEAHITVADTGIGIDASFLPHIFEPFKQETGGMRRRYEGSGLGLAIVHRLVEMMDGTIDVESEKHRGTTFTVVLPTS